ncbi:hypothetical protein NIES2100_27440 [Calothrix sp. NIES-2100]|uniref:hypothetical protein n=1 Tax=Calothrix sp. NIES-2100 TaxID=1954172 RepID=UPI000B5E48F0|nr:hypothetical protein NIES2100_27440 [Calothrix sp. NIES-2100]
MTQFPHDDQDLVNFLREHRPPVPPASPDLEQQILQQIPASVVKPQRHLGRLWLVSPVVAASLVAAVVSYRVLVPPKPSAAELATLESFMESNWQSTKSDRADSYILHFTEVDTD